MMMKLGFSAAGSSVRCYWGAGGGGVDTGEDLQSCGRRTGKGGTAASGSEAAGGVVCWLPGSGRQVSTARWQAGLERKPPLGECAHMQSFRMETAPFAGRREPHFQSVQRGALSWRAGT